jgi:phosphatidylserine decarboxylase
VGERIALTALSPAEPEAPASALAKLFLQEDLNFLVTNRIPRRMVTRAIGRVSKVRNRLFTRAAMSLWRLFADDLRLEEAEEAEFECLQDCFTRRLRAGARPISEEPGVLVSPCDAVVGANGTVERGLVFQAKGFPYRVEDLLPDASMARRLEGSRYVTLRLKANMYHRFHTPTAGTLRRVTYVSGDTWNVNPIALARVERLFCRNERVVLDVESEDAPVVLVAVAAIGVATVRVHALGASLHLAHRGPNVFDVAQTLSRGDELGYFEAGSTILVFVAPTHDMVREEGDVVRMGEPLFRRGDQ